MFGAVFIFGLLIYAIIHFFHNVREDYDGRQRYYDPSSNTYLSYDGTRRNINNGAYRFIYHKNGDRYMEGDDVGVVNLSQQEREKEYERLKSNHDDDKTTMFYAKDSSEDIIKGARYRDLNTGEIYVLRDDKEHNQFYVTLNNKVVRFSDTEKRNKKLYGVYDEKKEMELIEKFQTEINRASQDPFWKDPTMIFQRGNVSLIREK